MPQDEFSKTQKAKEFPVDIGSLFSFVESREKSREKMDLSVGEALYTHSVNQMQTI